MDESNELNKADIKFVLKSFDKVQNVTDDIYVPISTPEALFSHARYKKDKPLVIYIAGFRTWLSKKRSRSHDSLTAAYARYRPDINFVVRFDSFLS